MKIILKFLLILLITWPLSVASQEPSPSQRESNRQEQTQASEIKKKPHYDQSRTNDTPPVVKVIQSSRENRRPEKQSAQKQEESFNDKLIAWGTVALAVITAFLALFTFRLWKSTGRLVISAEETAKRQLRAFIFGKGFNHGPNIWDGKIKEYVFSVTWENVGLTPGVDVCNWFQFKTLPVNDEQDIIFAPSIERRSTVMGPRATAQTSYLTIPLETMMKCWRKEITIFIWSRVEYRDIFDQTTIHHHEQCASIDFIHDPSAIPPEGHPPYIQFTIYGPQNSTG
jgi:hypothetical protein